MNPHSSWHRRALAAASLTTATAIVLAGCTSPPPPAYPDDALGLVVGAHANAPAQQINGQINDVVGDAVTHQSWVAVIGNSGRPTVTTQGPLTLDCNNQISCQQKAADNTRQVDNAVTAVKAQDPENNLLSALDIGARTLSGHTGHRVLVVLDSGLQTITPLQLQDPGVLGADPTEIADYLELSGALAQLDGITVIFAGIGDTAAPQKPLPPAARAHLRAIWAAIAHRAGATDVTFVDTPHTNPPATDLPPVTPVPIDDPPSFSRPVVDLTDATVGFRPNTTELRDPGAAQQVLAGLAERIIRTRAPVTLTGTTANVGPLASQIVLGQARSEAIRTILVGELGVPPELITRVEGVGSDWAGYVPDHDAQGRLLPGPAAHNRNVIATFDPPA